jgi:hypothetical protein
VPRSWSRCCSCWHCSVSVRRRCRLRRRLLGPDRGQPGQGRTAPSARRLRAGDNVMRLVSALGSQTGNQLRTETGAPNLDLPRPDGGWESRGRQGSGANYGPTTDHDGRTQRTSTVNHGHQRDAIHARQPRRPDLGVKGSRVQISPARQVFGLVRGILATRSQPHISRSQPVVSALCVQSVLLHRPRPAARRLSACAHRCRR